MKRRVFVKQMGMMRSDDPTTMLQCSGLQPVTQWILPLNTIWLKSANDFKYRYNAAGFRSFFSF